MARPSVTHEQVFETANALVREARAIAEERLAANKQQDKELQTLRHQVEQLRIEAATLTERAAHVEELRVLVKTLQGQPGGILSPYSKPPAPV